MPSARYSDQHKEVMALLRKALGVRSGCTPASASAVINQILNDYGAAIASEWLGSHLPGHFMNHGETVLHHDETILPHRSPEPSYSNKPRAASSCTSESKPIHPEAVSEQEAALQDLKNLF